MPFPKGFLIGASTAAHQVEGNNINSDYWAQEQMPHSSFTEPSGIACDHYNRYEEDIRLMAQAGLNAYRFSIEWARIEPEEGRFDENEIRHYRKVIHCCRENGVEPIVTLMHFTSPVWLIKKGGWEAENTIGYFRRYAAYVAEKLGDEIRYICTINEANMGLQLAAISKRFQLMARQARENAQKAEGTVQVGMNFQKMMENIKYAAMENAEIFGTPPRKTPLFSVPRSRRFSFPPVPRKATSWYSALIRQPRKPSKPFILKSRLASPCRSTICRRFPADKPLQRMPGMRNSATIFPTFRKMISWVYRIIPAPNMDRKASCPVLRGLN